MMLIVGHFWLFCFRAIHIFFQVWFHFDGPQTSYFLIFENCKYWYHPSVNFRLLGVLSYILISSNATPNFKFTSGTSIDLAVGGCPGRWLAKALVAIDSIIIFRSHFFVTTFSHKMAAWIKNIIFDSSSHFMRTGCHKTMGTENNNGINGH